MKIAHQLRMLRRVLSAAFPAAAVFLASSAFASTTAGLFLSTHSSDETPASLLRAKFEFEVTGSTLTFTAFNLTESPDTFNINELYFNFGGSVTGLSAISIPTGWTFLTDQAADGFGRFDIALIDGVGQDPAQIVPGESVSFVFTILGSGVASDFVSTMSSVPPGDRPAFAAAKFVGGPGDDSAFGAVIPAPGSAGVALFAAISATRRRR